ncbi:Ig-like domain-containing protein [Chitinilyticum litopenaei]|uniref:Ig-like domain-containing protein n=1 Tax=Chitinilyticum litopenaei TaxID=1121276 RepID=UPI000404F324|nr:Ig-like domain-containing protein [Chitinilyticum litopenaei]
MDTYVFERSITFVIPGSATTPSVQVKAVEADGDLQFTLSVLNAGNRTADLRGLFFDFNSPDKLPGLTPIGSKVNRYDSVDVIDLGNGANLLGVAEPFDFGVEFGTQGIARKNGDDIQSTAFTLTGLTDLSLDDIANVQFGARLSSIGALGGARNDSAKLTVLAPAAPDAVDDSYAIREDGVADLATPTHVPTAQLFQVLLNDSDADGDELSIVDVRGVAHGTLQIVDGDDADSLADDAILYTPDADYAGTDHFEYLISDNNGGTDYSDVDITIEAVADVPDLEYEALAGESVDQVIVRVTATQTDADSSEYIDRLELQALPEGVTVEPGTLNPGDEPDQLVQDFLLTLPTGEDVSFDFGVTAVAKEVSNGDEESRSIAVPIVLDFTANDYAPSFLATDQSIWDSGEEFVFTDDRFLGVDDGFSDSSGGLIGYSVSADVKAGFQSTLTFEGGEVDARLDYEFGVDTNYNKATDMLLISSSQMLVGGDFATQGPQGSYILDFIFNYAFSAALTYDIELDSGNILSVSGSNNFTQNILNLNSDDLELEIPFPDPFGSLSATLAWPNISTDAEADGGGAFSADGESNNFLQLNVDVDQALADIFLGGVNPFDVGFDIGVVWGNLEVLDLDVYGGLNFLQSFLMQEQGFNGTLHFENGVDQAFVFGADILLADASLIDQGGDNDGQVEFTLSLDPQATLSNDTDLGFNVGFNFDVLKASGGYDVVVDSGSFSIGPIYNTGGDMGIATVGIYDNTFALNFAAQEFGFYA